MNNVFILFFVMIFSKGVFGMSFLGMGKVCVFSELTVHLTLDGVPLANKKVTRQWEWDNLNSDEMMTNNAGLVSFPAVFESSVFRLLPMELVVGQQLSVELDGNDKVFWTNSKREPKENAEYGGVVFLADCELNDEEVLIEDYGSLMVTQCKLIDR